MSFSDPLDPASITSDGFAFKIWSLKRSANYGSKHVDEHALDIAAARLSADARTVTLDIPTLAPTQCYELKARIVGSDGSTFERSIHGTIHRLSGK